MLRILLISFIGLVLAAQGSEPAEQRSVYEAQEHWAFRPPAFRPVAVPPDSPDADLRSTGGFGNLVDAFIDSHRRKRGLSAGPAASRAVWLRRVYLDLIGLPPSLEEIDAFERDQDPTARQKVVERLLGSPQYGERWARHFMDIWRYCDWWGLGDQLRYSQKHIWHWRDWMVESLNSDKGYDRMVVQQLAGDEIEPGNVDTLRATGFLARDYYLFNRASWLDNVVEHTGKAFLGLTMNCARCHDHKYDPITQVDYFAWRAIFEPYHARLDELPGETDLEKDGLPRVFDLHLDRPTYVQIKGDPLNPDKTRPVEPAIPGALGFASLSIRNVDLPSRAQHPSMQPWVIANHREAAERAIVAARKRLEEAEQSLASAVGTSEEDRARFGKVAAATALAAAEQRSTMITAAFEADVARMVPAGTAPDLIQLCERAARAQSGFELAQAEAGLVQARLDKLLADSNKEADASKKLEKAAVAWEEARKKAALPGTNYTSLRGSFKALEGPDETEASRKAPYPGTSTGRRRALAQWIVDRRNPLTARVLVNHVWARHFGQPLVAGMTDFGLRAPVPEHQDLLDWLALDFMEQGWSLKHLHRRMLLSETYALSSATTGTRDPENKYYERMNTQRLDAQTIRDSMLQLAGTLDLTIGGPTIDPTREDTAMRRSLYFKQSPEDLHKFLETFDNANPKECYRRAESILPQQALALANSKLASDAAARLAGRFVQRGAAGDGFLGTAFETVLGVKATREELDACREGYARLLEASRQTGSRDPEGRARAAFVHALFNHNDFISVR